MGKNVDKDAYRLYPALIKRNDNGGGYLVKFIDIPQANFEAKSFEEALGRAEGALLGFIYTQYARVGRARNKMKIPDPSPVARVEGVAHERGYYLHLVPIADYFARGESRVTKKTVTIPDWVNDLGLKAGINFSQLLTNAIVHEIGIGLEMSAACKGADRVI